jgi:hypothetical protein
VEEEISGTCRSNGEKRKVCVTLVGKLGEKESTRNIKM